MATIVAFDVVVNLTNLPAVGASGSDICIPDTCIYEWCSGFILNQCPDSGEVLNATSGIISIGPYGNNWKCTWIIAPPKATQIMISFTYFSTQGPAGGTVGDWVFVWDCCDIQCNNTNLLGRYSGTSAVIPNTILSNTGILRLEFISDFDWNANGFTVAYSVPCPAGTFGSGEPSCQQCLAACPAGKSLVLGTCGAFGATADNTCACPAGEYSDSIEAPCLPCPGACVAGDRTHGRDLRCSQFYYDDDNDDVVFPFVATSWCVAVPLCGSNYNHRTD